MIGTTGYVKITDFNENTYDQFKKALENLVGNQGAQSLIFDLRHNTGGLVDPAIKMLDMLLPEGVIATATYRDGSTEVLGNSDANCIDLPMAVLTNENTASAAELFTQALRDYNVAKSVGTNTYGKGVMQVTHSLKDGSAIRITIAQYNPPKSANYDGVGIKPDYEVALTEEQQAIFDTLDENTDPQLKKALEVVNAGAAPSETTPAQTQTTEPTTGKDAETTEPVENKDGESTTPTEGSETSESAEGQTDETAKPAEGEE